MLLSAVFKLAKRRGYYSPGKPVRDTATSPKAPAPQETYAYDLPEIQQMLSVMQELAATIFRSCSVHELAAKRLGGFGPGRLPVWKSGSWPMSRLKHFRVRFGCGFHKREL